MSFNCLNYLKIAFSYGFARKLFYTKDLIEYKEIKIDKTYTSPFLISDKMLLSLYSGIISIYMFPIYTILDIRNIELYMRNYNYKITTRKEITFQNLLFDPHMNDFEMEEKNN
jgi:hypothetical protein